VSPSAAIKLMQRVRATGACAGPLRRPSPPAARPYQADLARLVPADLGPQARRLQPALQRRCGISAGLSTIHNTFGRIGLRHKKRSLKGRRTGPSRSCEPAPAMAGLATLHGPFAVVFLDGTQTATNMATATAAARAASAWSPSPQRHWQTTTLIAGLKQSGVVAPLVRDGPFTGRCWAPTRRSSWRRH
jgi:hypothetical protein